MQRKVKRDVRIVFNLSIDMVTGCEPGKKSIIHVKRGEKIHASSSSLEEDSEGKVHVNMFRSFTSTLKRHSDSKCKKKELKIRIEEAHSQIVTTLSYDLGKDIIEESFPERRVIIRDRNGLMELYLKLNGVKENFLNQQQSIQLVCNSSCSSYMHAPSTGSSLIRQERTEPCINNSTATTAIAVDDYVSVIESLTESAGNEKIDDIIPSRLEDVSDVDTERNEEIKQLLTSPPLQSKESVVSPGDNNSKGSISLKPAFGVNSDVAVERRTISSSSKPRPPLRLPSKRIIVSSRDPVEEVLKQIAEAVNRSSRDIHGECHKKEGIPKGAQLILDFYLNNNSNNQKEEILERFVVWFVAHVLAEVCQETRHIGNWLNNITHVIYNSILDSSYISNNILPDFEEMTSQIDDMKEDIVNVHLFRERGKEMIRKFSGRSNTSVAIKVFWLAGLDSVARMLLSLSVCQVERLCNDFPYVFPFPEGDCCCWISLEERLIATTAVVLSQIQLTLSTLISPPSHGKVVDIRSAPPLYRIVLGNLMMNVFKNLITAITDYMCKEDRLNDGGTFPVALKILKFLIHWSRKHFLLSVLSPFFVPLVAFCDSVLLPHDLLQNNDYRLYIQRFFPSCAAGTRSQDDGQSQSVCMPPISTIGSENLTFSVFTLLRGFTEAECTEAHNTENGLSSLVEVLNGDKDDAEHVLETEEVFPGSGFNGTRLTLSEPSRILPLLLREVKLITASL